MGDHFISARYWLTSSDPRGLPGCKGKPVNAHTLWAAWTIVANSLGGRRQPVSVWPPRPRAELLNGTLAGSVSTIVEDVPALPLRVSFCRQDGPTGYDG